ncbi:MAG: choice-of-anchor Q domain-containing protein [Methylococcales bacterium]
MKTTTLLRITIYILLIFMPISSWALSFTVTNTNDSGDGSLRQAISDANSSIGEDTIEFDLNLTGQIIFLTSGVLEIMDDLIIQGLGANVLTISGSNRSTIFNIDHSGEQTIIDGITITEGSHSAIALSANLTLTNSIISSNETGIAQENTGNTQLSVTNCVFSENIFSGISARGSDGESAIINVTDSTFSNNGSGMNIWDSSLTVKNSTISDNMFFGITILDGSARIFDSTLSNNGSDISLLDLGLGRPGGAIRFINVDTEGGPFRSLRVVNTTISGNSAINGGAIHVSDGSGNGGEMTINLTNSTIIGNLATQKDGFIFLDPIEFVSPTEFPNVRITVNNTIIAGNIGTKSDVVESFVSNGHNLIDTIEGTTGFETDTIEPEITNILDPVLNNNGGSTQTHNLSVDSVAIDAAGSDCPPPETDQRGIPRPQGAGCDIGAVEFQDIDVPPVEVSMCEIRTEYESGGCKGKFNAFSLDDLEAYKATNFGKNGRKKFRNLVIRANIGEAGDRLDIESPCQIVFGSGVSLTGDFVSLDGRKGVWTNNLDIQSEGAACLLSETGNVKVKANSNIIAKQLVIQANKIAKIGKNTQVNVSDSLTIQATGSPSKSRAIIDKGANLLVGSDMILDSVFRAVIQSNAVVDVAGNLEMNAKKLNNCVVKKSAAISFGSQSGVCAARLP